MWKSILSIATLLILSFVLGWAIEKDPGLVLISYDDWSVETSLWFGLATLTVLIFALYFIYKLLKHGFVFPSRLAKWALARKQRLAELEVYYGLCELLENNWSKAERKLNKSIKHVRTPFTNYLGSALAAHKQNSFNQRDQYLQKAAASLEGSETAVSLLKAQLQMSSDQTLQALHELEALHLKDPKHPQILNLLQKIYLTLGNWPALLNLLPSIAKYSGLKDEALKNLSREVYAELLQQAAKQHDDAVFEQAWLAIPTAWKTNPDLIAIYSNFHLAEGADTEKIIKPLEDALKKNWDDRLVKLYGLAISSNTAKQLKQAESWLKSHPRDSQLLLCLGRLSIREKLWGKAQDYLSASLGIDPQAVTYWELAKVQEQLNLQDVARQSYRKGLELAAKLALS